MDSDNWACGKSGTQYGDWMFVPDGADLPDKSVMHQMIRRAIETVLEAKPDRFERLEIILKDWSKEDNTIPDLAGKKTVGFKAIFFKD